MTDAVRYAREGTLAVVTLDDGKVNAMSLPFFRALQAALDRAEADDPAAIVITGRPGVFSAGLDVKLLPTLPAAELRETLLTFGRTLLRLFTLPLPTVAAVSGHAIAGGALLAFACDLRVAADGPFRLQLNEVAIGLTLPTWAIVLACAAVPPRWHTEAILHARGYAPAEALARQILDRVVPPERLLEAAREAAVPLAGLDHGAYGGSKARLRATAVRLAMDRLDEESPGRLPAKQP
ncbi:MAG TPA: crotonase/enoyl-CoA hydratase family protein [Candidatus Binatia bacterium]|nr:crotonase/enoyl-CoA hydratase family protein [Candidatus Binatia bacterium]